MPSKRPRYRLTWASRLELADTGQCQVWMPPTVNPDTDEVSWGRWATVRRWRGQLVEYEPNPPLELET